MDHAIEGTVVQVAVKNLSRAHQTVHVVVEATTADGTKVRGTTPVSVFAGETAETVVGFTDQVEDVGSVGIIDEGQPI